MTLGTPTQLSIYVPTFMHAHDTITHVGTCAHVHALTLVCTYTHARTHARRQSHSYITHLIFTSVQLVLAIRVIIYRALKLK